MARRRGTTDPGNNSATDTDTLTSEADLSITKDDGVTSVVPGTPDTYTIVVSNAGPSDVTGAALADPVPADVTAATWTFVSAAGGGSVAGPTSGSGALATTVDLPSGATVTFTFTVQIDPSATGSLSNTATVSPPAGVTDTIPGNDSATDTDTLTPLADLSITNTDGLTMVVPGTSTTYTIVVTNAGPSTAVDQAVNDLFPPEITGVTWTAVASAGSSVAADSGTGNIVTSVTLLPGGTITFTAVSQISPAATGTLTNTATVAVPPGDNTPDNNTATDIDTLTPQADLAITKTDGVSSVVPGTPNTYTIVVSNAGPSAVTGAALSDLVPAGVTATTWTFVSATGGGSVSGPTSGSGALATTVDLPAGATVTFTFTAQVDPSATGTLDNTATVSPPAGVTDTIPGNDSATDTDTLTPLADLAITNTDGVTAVVPGTSTTYTIVVSNAGPSTAVDQAVNDLFPPEITGVNWTAVASAGSSVAAASGAGNIVTTVTLLPGGTVTFTAVAQINAAAVGTLTNTATVAVPPGDNTPADNSAMDIDTLTPEADLAITKTDGVGSVVPGTSNVYTIVVSNAGPSAVSGAGVSDPVPAGVTAATWTFVSATGGGVVAGPSSGSGGLGTTVDLPAGATVTFTFTAQVSPSATGTLDNTATVSPPAGVTDTNLNNNSALDTDTLTPLADLAITKSDGVSSVVPGMPNIYTIVVSNAGPDAVSGAGVSDLVPAGVTAATWTFVSATGGGSVSGQTSGSGALATTVDLPAGATVTFTFTVQIDPSATGSLSNIATVSPPAGVTDTIPGNNSGTDTDTLTPEADLAITKSVSDATPDVGGTISFTVTLTNNGPSNATGVQVQDQLPTGLSVVSAIPSEGTYDASTGQWNVGAVNPGSPATLVIVARADSAGSLTNTAMITHADQLDQTLGNNVSSVLVTASAATVVAPPSVTSLQRFGFHDQPTVFVLTFSSALDPTRAQDLGNYQLTLIAHGGRLHLPVHLTGAVYDAAANSVTLHPAKLLPLRFHYMLVVNGTSPTGVSGPSGVLLDGAGKGVPGSNYVRHFGREILAGSNRPDGRHGPVPGHQSQPARTRAVRLSGLHAAHQAPARARHSAGVPSVAGRAPIALNLSAVDAALESFLVPPHGR